MIQRFAICSLTCLLGLSGQIAWGELQILSPLKCPDVPAGLTASDNPIDAFIAARYLSEEVEPVGPADPAELLRRVYLDLIGIPPTIEQQREFLRDPSPEAYRNVVDQLLNDDQHGVRYGRHWLDVLRYADADDATPATDGIWLWRDWVINALNEDIPYDQFVRAQLTGYRDIKRTQISATGYRTRREPRPDDQFALGFLSRNGIVRDGQATGELAIAAVETTSTAFMGMTVGCAKCHDHFYDKISIRDFYAMKSLFDPLVLRKLTLATPAEIFAQAAAQRQDEQEREEREQPLLALTEPYRRRLYDDRVAMLPAEIQEVIRIPERERTAAQQKIADDYYPILRIDEPKILEVLSEEDRETYQQLKKKLDSGGGRSRRSASLPVFWTVEVDPVKADATSYVLTSGDPLRPELDHPVQPGWPFAPDDVEFRDGRIETFSDWLTAPENPFFARVAVNRLWQWHFGQGLQKLPSDFGLFGQEVSHPQLLDWLADEFVTRGFNMKEMHRLMVTSQTYQMASAVPAKHYSANHPIDPANTMLWHFPLRRLDAEAIWDSLFAAAGTLDQSTGGPSFALSSGGQKSSRSRSRVQDSNAEQVRRGAYLFRGYASSREVLPDVLQAFDVDDGRVPCPVRTQTITAPQALFLMNSEVVDVVATRLAGRLACDSDQLPGAVDQGYQIALGRLPSQSERATALDYLADDPARLRGFAWLLLNLDEFLFVR